MAEPETKLHHKGAKPCRCDHIKTEHFTGKPSAYSRSQSDQPLASCRICYCLDYVHEPDPTKRHKYGLRHSQEQYVMRCYDCGVYNQLPDTHSRIRWHYRYYWCCGAYRCRDCTEKHARSGAFPRNTPAVDNGVAVLG